MGKPYRRKRDGVCVVAESLGFEIDQDGRRRRVRRLFYGTSPRAAVANKQGRLTSSGFSLF
jgi:hypothetical protein